MPVLWQSSQKPMYVRTVWIDGFRHAVLTHDDPYFINTSRRPHSSATITSKSTTNTNKRNSRRDRENLDLEDCFSNFNFVIKKEHITRQRPKSSRDIELEKLDLSDVEQSEEGFLVRAGQQPIYALDSSRSRFENIYSSMRTLKTNRTTRCNSNNTETELSERVLQWLDLAGKVDLLAPVKVERMNQPRHSCPEIQRRNLLAKSKTSVDVSNTKTASPKVDSAKTEHQMGPIDHHDFYSNTIENYARQSRNNSLHEIHAKLNNKTKAMTKAKDIRTNIIETRQKIALERSVMEKKYAELITKKLIPDVKGNKKQVHIFLPDLPKKTSSNATSRTESLLSVSQFSQLTQKS